MALFEGLSEQIQGKPYQGNNSNNSASGKNTGGGLFGGLASDFLSQENKVQESPLLPAQTHSEAFQKAFNIAIKKEKPLETITQQPQSAIFKGSSGAAIKSMKDTFDDTVKRIEDVVSSSGQDVSPAKRIGSIVRAGVGIVNLAFSPVTAAIKAGENIGVGESISSPSGSLLLKAASTVMGKGPEIVSEKVINPLVKKSFQKLPESAQPLEPAAEELANLAAIFLIGKGIHTATDIAAASKNKAAIVESAANTLGVPVEKNVLGSIKKIEDKVIDSKYRQLAHETHPDSGGTPQEFQVVNTAKNILKDSNTLSTKEFNKKYGEKVIELQKKVSLLSEEKPTETPLKTKELVQKSTQEITTAGEIKPVGSIIKTSPIPETVSTDIGVKPSIFSGIAEEIRSSTQKEGLDVVTVKAPKEASLKIVLKDTPEQNNIMKELIGSEGGKRIAVENVDKPGYTFIAQKSTFPEWIPEKLRSKKLIDSVVRHIQDGTFPKGSAQRNLYDIVSKQIRTAEKVSTVDETSSVKLLKAQERANLYNPFLSDAENAALVEEFDRKNKLPAAPNVTIAPENIGVVSNPKASKVGKSIEAKNIEAGLARSFGDTAEYNAITIKDQAKMASDILMGGLDNIIPMVRGEMPLTPGLRAGAFIKAVEDYATETGNVDLALELARSPLTSETSIHAQEMRLLAERDKDSVTINLKKIQKIKEESLKNKKTSKSDVVSDIKKEIAKQKPTKETWESFIDSITC